MTQPQQQSLPTPAGEVAFDGDHATLRFVRTYPHPPEAVWAALTEPEQLAAWYMTQAVIDGREGGSVQMTSGPARFEWTGRILTWEPYRLYEYEWNIAPRTELPNGEQSVVRWELEPVAEGTKLTLTHRHLTKGTAMGFAPGTHAFMDRLGDQLGQQPLTNWMQRYDEVKHAYPAWQPNF
ncbi:MAG TPA: SRPBCC family protein [Stenomitos sp.]